MLPWDDTSSVKGNKVPRGAYLAHVVFPSDPHRPKTSISSPGGNLGIPPVGLMVIHRGHICQFYSFCPTLINSPVLMGMSTLRDPLTQSESRVPLLSFYPLLFSPARPMPYLRYHGTNLKCVPKTSLCNTGPCLEAQFLLPLCFYVKYHMLF